MCSDEPVHMENEDVKAFFRQTMPFPKQRAKYTSMQVAPWTMKMWRTGISANYIQRQKGCCISQCPIRFLTTAYFLHSAQTQKSVWMQE